MTEPYREISGGPLRSWALDQPLNSPFATPRGPLGRLAGRFMRWTGNQADVLTVLDVQPGEQVLEVGYGPGGLIRLLADRTAAALIRGVDPATAMRDLATRHNRAACRAGRVELRTGTADDTGLADQSVDRVVSVNNVAFWPDLDAGVAELHRVVRPAGTVLVGWHGGTSPSLITRRLRLPGDKLTRIEHTLAAHFTAVTRRQLANLDVFTAIR